MEKLILNSTLPPGDILMLTAAVRDLHRCYPGSFLTDVRTRFPELWENNPGIAPLTGEENVVEQVDCQYPLVQKSNSTPAHFLEGFIHYLNERLNLRIELTEIRGDVYLSENELRSPSPVAELNGYDGPYWIVVAGGKRDFTIKWWDTVRYQRVVDHFEGKIQFVQVGGAGDFHPELNGVIDLRGKTNLRQLIRLVHHSDGVLCPVTFLMHLAAAVPTKVTHRLRPCVVIAGGREPPHWEAYPGHQFLHTVGMLPCCRTGGCWRARTKPLRDNSHFNRPEYLCVDVVGNLPQCMDMISANDVIRRIELFLEGEPRFDGLIRSERERMGLDGGPTDQAGRINRGPIRPTPASIKAGGVRDTILRHYRDLPKVPKRSLLEDITERALTNTPQGLGDTILLTQLPRVAADQGKSRYIASDSVFFEPLMKHNRYYQPAGNRARIAANVLQLRYDLGNGHFMQRLQRAFGLQPQLLPSGHIDTSIRMKRGTIALHFEPGSTHAAWQRLYVHPRARQLYPESQRVIQEFVDGHREMRFLQIGRTPTQFRNVEDFTGLPLARTIQLLSECEYFIGIVSGPMHLATALGLKCVVILNFPDAGEIYLPVLKDINLIESEWLYPQNVHLHQENDGPLVRRLTLQSLEKSVNGEIYPYWSKDCLDLIYEQM